MDILNRLTDKSRLEGLLNNVPSPETCTIDAVALEADLKASVYGQDEVCRDVARQIKTRFAKETRKKPIGVFLLAGPPATGKTWFAKVLSKALDKDKPLLHYDMTQFSQPHTVAQLFGQPKGYAGSDSYGKLTGDLRSTPKCVILLDEIEKAHPEVRTKFLTAWNDGFVTEASNGAPVSTVNAIFVLTTNAAQRQITDLTKQYGDNRAELSRACAAALKDVFAPEFLSRIDYVFPFVPLGNLDLARVVAHRLEEEVKEYGLEVDHIEADVLVRSVHLARAREADPREIARQIESQISEQIIELKEAGIKRLRIIDTGEGIAVEAAEPPPRSGKRI